MHDTRENETEHVTPYACLARYLQEERKRRCEKLRAAAAERSRDIIAEYEQREREIRAAAADEQEDLKTEIRASILRPARRNAESVTLRQLGEGVDRALEGCRKRLRAFAASPAFGDIIPLLLAEAASCAARLTGTADGAPLGTVVVAPADADACRAAVGKLGLSIEVREDDAIWGGVMIETPGREHLVHNTLETRMFRKEYELRAVATGMFEQAFRERNTGDERP